MSDSVDLFIIGGGINGAGIARDAAGRGLSVVLCEKDDLAEATSSRSSKLIHGGLRYLEHYDFMLVRKALIEREILMNMAPHIIGPMRFVLPHSPKDRPAWLIRLGLFLYDNLGGRKKLPGTRTLDLLRDPEGAQLKESFVKGFEYSDCWVDDARLVLLNALDASEMGAEILSRTACTSARRENGLWKVETTNKNTGARRTVRAKALVNAGGPWVNEIIDGVVGSSSPRNIKLVKGSHLIVPKFWEGEQAFLVQNIDKRVVFIIPYENDKALIGTTDIPYSGRPEDVAIDKDEIRYLLEVVSRYFKAQLREQDVGRSFSGVRPLFDDKSENPSAVTRDFQLDLDDDNGAPLLSIFGGKITTYRKLAEQAMVRLGSKFPEMKPTWTESSHLPGGDMAGADFPSFLNDLRQQYPWLPFPLLKHYGRLYGTRSKDILGKAGSIKDLGQQFGPKLFEREARYLQQTEWAQSPEDILYRRTKHGLHMDPAERDTFEDWFNSQISSSVSVINRGAFSP